MLSTSTIIFKFNITRGLYIALIINHEGLGIITSISRRHFELQSIVQVRVIECNLTIICTVTIVIVLCSAYIFTTSRMFQQIERSSRSSMLFVDISNGNLRRYFDRILGIGDSNRHRIGGVRAIKQSFVIKQSLILYNNLNGSCTANISRFLDFENFAHVLSSRTALNTCQSTLQRVSQCFVCGRNLIVIEDFKFANNRTSLGIFCNRVFRLHVFGFRFFVHIRNVHRNRGRSRASLTVRNDNLEFPYSLSFVIELASIRHDKFVRAVQELKRNIFRSINRKGERIIIRVCSRDFAYSLTTRPIATISLFFCNGEFLRSNNRVIIFVLDFDSNLELFRSQRTSLNTRFCSSIIRDSRIDDIFFLFAVIQNSAGLHLNSRISVSQLDNLEGVIKSIKIAASLIN